MNSILKLFIGAWIAGAGGAFAQTVVMELETSENLRDWERVAVGPELLTGQGGILQDAAAEGRFFRLRIRAADADGFYPVLLLEEAPQFAVRIAEDFIREFTENDADARGGTDDPIGLWVPGARLGPVCYSIYDPAVNDGGRRPTSSSRCSVRIPRRRNHRRAGFASTLRSTRKPSSVTYSLHCTAEIYRCRSSPTAARLLPSSSCGGRGEGEGR